MSESYNTHTQNLTDEEGLDFFLQLDPLLTLLSTYHLIPNAADSSSSPAAAVQGVIILKVGELIFDSTFFY